MKFLPKYVVTFVLCFEFSLGSKLKNNSQPHIIVILGDDIGWNDFGFHGSSQIPTPNIDALGYNGVFLNKFYTQPTCSPSRAAFLTGIYPIRYGYQGIPLSAGEDKPLPHDLELLPEKLKKLGYKTHLVGKWHLSAGRKNDTPTARGFDTHFGYWNGYIGYFDYFSYQNITGDWGINVGGKIYVKTLYMLTRKPNIVKSFQKVGFDILKHAEVYNLTTIWSGLDLHDRFKPQWEYQGKYATDLFTEKSLAVIDNHNENEPLFLYLGHLAAHTGANGTELGVLNITETEEKYSYIEEPRRRRFAEIVNRLDISVGQVVNKLKERNMLENSIVLFFSDNGAQTIGLYENTGSNYPLKGLKFTLLEGGVRGSAVLFSPLLEKKGYINNHLMHITDLYSTFLSVAGGRPEIHQTYDGIDQWHSITSDLPSQRREILLNIDEINGFSGLIDESGRYKFLNGSYLNGIYDGALGDTGRSTKTPAYDINAILQSEVNRAIQNLPNSSPLTSEKIKQLRKQLDISSCNGIVRNQDLPCLGECLFDLWNDPCEAENLINKKPLVKAYLKDKLNKYLKEIQPSRNRKTDLNSNPKYCNNTWFPWLDKDGCYTGSSKDA